MIVDTSIILNWIFRGGEFERECLKLREEFERGNISLKVPDVVAYDVCIKIAESDIPTDVASKLVHLSFEYLKYISVSLDSRMLGDVVRVCRDLNVNFAVASCVVLSRHLNEMYVTADSGVYRLLSDAGIKVSHVRDLF